MMDLIAIEPLESYSCFVWFHDTTGMYDIVLKFVVPRRRCFPVDVATFHRQPFHCVSATFELAAALDLVNPILLVS